MLFLPPTSVEPSVFLIFYRLSRAAHQPALPVGCFWVPVKSVPLSLCSSWEVLSALSHPDVQVVCTAQLQSN